MLDWRIRGGHSGDSWLDPTSDIAVIAGDRASRGGVETFAWGLPSCSASGVALEASGLYLPTHPNVSEVHRHIEGQLDAVDNLLVSLIDPVNPDRGPLR